MKSRKNKSEVWKVIDMRTGIEVYSKQMSKFCAVLGWDSQVFRNHISRAKPNTSEGFSYRDHYWIKIVEII